MNAFRICIGVDRLQSDTMYHFLLLLPGNVPWAHSGNSVFSIFATLKLEVVTCAYSYLIISKVKHLFSVSSILTTLIFSFVNFLFISLAYFSVGRFFSCCLIFNNSFIETVTYHTVHLF